MGDQRRFIRFSDDELIRLEDYIDDTDRMYEEIQEEFRRREIDKIAEQLKKNETDSFKECVKKGGVS